MELSHRPHMVYNLFSLWKTVNPGGLFVVYGYGLPGRGILNGPDFNAVAKFKQFIDTLSRWSTNQLNLSIMEGDEQICSIEFGNNLVAFKKLGPSFMTASPNTETPSLLMLNSPFVVYHTTSYASKKESVFFRRQWGLRKCRQPASENQRSANRNEHFK
ncbi:tylE [Symbiodinium pilosum]|uniref:TylE protein n=1 Tax=Symbiodinium pilosum TaxID=2952 RepID=A0A812WI44_SYMPI|nr:tylE [Symbiodinium pilosum]